MSDKGETVGTTTPDLPSSSEVPATFARPEARFTLGDEIGRGGMGRVVAATDVSLDREVAIKHMLSRDSGDLSRFEREVRITAQLEHPSIVPIHEAGIDELGRPFYVMRRIEGEPLADRLARSSSVRDRLALVPNLLAVVDAAAFAHARNIIHRDIKPSNILLGAYGETLLIDWGLARRTDDAELARLDSAPGAEEPEPLTRTGHVYGTIAYMAPEQARGEPVDARADVYALGVTLFHVLTGKSPFEGMSAIDRIAAAVLRADPPFDRMPPEVPAELVTITRKAMENELDRRYRDARELAADLRAFLAGQLVAAHRYSRIDRMTRFVRRYRVAIAIASVAIIAAIGIGIVALLGIMHARDVADQARTLAEARAESMLLDRASTLAEVDPVRAVALLRHVVPHSESMHRARDIAAVAAAKGIARGSSAHHKPINALQISPDGRSLLSAGEDGLLMIHDLATARTRTVADVGSPITSALWTDGGATITLSARAGVIVFDIASNVRRTLTTHTPTGLLAGPSRELVRYVDRKTFFEISTHGGAPRLLASDVEQVTNDGDLAAVSGSRGLRLLDGDREVALDVRPPDSARSLAVSRALGRVAMAVGGEVLEWNVRDGSLLARKPIIYTQWLMYGDRELYVSTSDGQLHAFGLRAASHRELLHSRASVLWGAMSKAGATFITEEGSLAVIDEIGPHLVLAERIGARGIAASASSMYVAIGSHEGLITWWDLTTLKPNPTLIPQFQLCGWDRTSIYSISLDELVKVNRVTSHPTTLLEDAVLASGRCAGTIGDGQLVVTGVLGTGIISTTTGTIRRLADITNLALDRDADSLIFSRGNTVIELARGTGPERVLWTGSNDIEYMASRGRWVAIGIADGTIVRFDRLTRTSATIKSSQLGMVALAASGDVWFTSAGVLSRWSGNAVTSIRSFSSPVLFASPLDDRLVVQLTDQSLWLVDRGGAINRAPAGARESLLGTRDLVVSSERNGRLVMRYLISGEHATRQLPGSILQFSVNDLDDQSVLAFVGDRYVYVFDDPVPQDPEKLAAWIDAATNAAVDPATDELVWR